MARTTSQSNLKADAEAEEDMREMKAKTMVENVRQMASILQASHVAVTFVEFPNEDHFSVVPGALDKAVPFALSDNLSAY